MEKYIYPSGWFSNKGNLQWEEWQKNNLAFHFKEEKREGGYIYLNDSSRNIWVILPFTGGKSYYASGGSSWTELYDVTLVTPTLTPKPSDTQVLPLQSINYLKYYRIPDDAPGIEYSPWRFKQRNENGTVMTKDRTLMLWGQYIMIDFLIKLGLSWKVSYDNVYEPVFKDSYSPIQLGDISPEYEIKQGSDELISGHKSHRVGLDVDIFVCSKGITPEKTDYSKINYSLEKTKALAQLIVQVANENNFQIDKIFYDDEKVREIVPKISVDLYVPHADHFHVRLLG